MELENHIVNERYDVLKSLQSGFYGTAWLSKDRKTGKDVCLKTFFKESKTQLKELAILKQLCEGHFAHDNVCKVFDVSLDKASVTDSRGKLVDTMRYVVFEYCSGSDMFNYLVTGPFEKMHRVSAFPEPLARHYFTQLLLAVLYLHERGVYHRDIKPENCVLDEHWDLKITDFGTNKIISTLDPAMALRTTTRSIGTDSYRAPEVNALKEYDPSAADLWSIGMTLFFLVAVEEMVARVQTLDQYTRAMFCPLGLFFPFPIHCSKLDSYMSTEQELYPYLNKGHVLQNKLFWLEWGNMATTLSPEIKDLMNRIFILVPSLRCSIREMLVHPWVSEGVRLTSIEIKMQMESRCPSSVQVYKAANPHVVECKLMGAVDLASLRQSITRSGAQEEYLTDNEVWVWSPTLASLEALQLEIAETDIQGAMIDLTVAKTILQNILLHPDNPKIRRVPTADIDANWTGKLFTLLGFLPQSGSPVLVLPDDHLDLQLIYCASLVLVGIELAMVKGAVAIVNYEDDGQETMYPEDCVVPSQSAESDTSTLPDLMEPSDLMRIKEQATLYVPFHRRFSHDDRLKSSQDGPQTQPSSQESSSWAGHSSWSLSNHSSQEESIDEMVSSDWMPEVKVDHSHVHRIVELTIVLDRKVSGHFIAAGEFCKLSGLLCSYGLYQVVCHQQLALYCKGHATSFSARVLTVDSTGTLGVSTWCFQGHDEWLAILHRLRNDMIS